MVNAQKLFEERIKNAMGDLSYEVIKLNIALELANQRIRELESEKADQPAVQE